MRGAGPLAIIETHPVQYRAPVYQALARDFGVPVSVIYGSDFSIAGYKDREFGAAFCWDVDLLSGTDARFLSRVEEGGAASFEEIRARGLGRAIDELRPSAVLATGYRPWFHLAGILEARRRGIPVLFRAEISDAAASAWRDCALRAVYSLCEFVLPIGVRSGDHYRRLGIAGQKVIISPYCVNTAPFQCEESDREALREPMRRSLGLRPDHLVVLFCGKLSERKGVHTLVAAMKRLPARLRSRAVLLCVGDGVERKTLVSACAAEPRIRGIFTGFRNQTELSPFYHAADVFVLPSLRGETWGLVVNEALHHGVPCVVSSAAGCGPDLIDSATGAIAEAGSVQKLADAIETVAGMAGREGTRSQCREKVARYSTAAAANGIAMAWRAVSRCPAMADVVPERPVA
jgi:glycosyltransferase involved in cell wall biosynthesis